MSKWRKRRLTLLLPACVALYFAAAACVLHFGLDRVLFPRTPAYKGSAAAATVSFKGKSGNELLVRRYGQPEAGCIVFFPGQHGALASYTFTSHVAAGLAVFVIAYPGQDGASGHAELEEIGHLVGEAVAAVLGECQPARTVFVGVSLGSMLAAYASKPVAPAGLVLVSAAPSLSSAIRVRLRSHPASAPLSWLPLSRVVPHDYSLQEALGPSTGARVVVFQGSLDEQTPIALLRSSGIFGGEVRLVSVPGATHATTFVLSQEEQLAAVLALIHGTAVCDPAILALRCEA